MRLSRKFVFVLVGLLVLGSAAAVWAYFAAGGSGAASASVGTLGTPTHVTTSNAAGSSTVGVSWTGVASPGSGTFGYFVQRFAGSTPSAACGTSAAALTANVTCNDTGVPNGTYTYKVTAVYNSWSAQSAASASVTVASDATPPVFGSPALTFSTTGSFTSASGGTVYYNPQGSNSGSFTVNAPNVADPDSGLQKVNFPLLGGMSGGGDVNAPGPYGTTYGWTASSTGSGSKNVTAYNNATLSSTASFSVVQDATAPTGGTITANGGSTFNTSGTVSLGKTDFTDSGSGIASNVITRASATLSGNACGSFSGATVVTISGGNDPAGLATGCYQYTLTGTDKVANAATATSTVVKVDRAAPTGGAVTANGGATFNTTGTVALSKTDFTDAQSGISSNIVTRASAPLSANACGSFVGAAVVTLSGGNDSTTLGSGCYRYTLTGTDNAGNAATATSADVKVDTSAPTLTITATGANVSTNGTNSVSFKTGGTGSFTITAADADTGVSSTTFPAAPTGWTKSGTNPVIYTLGTASAPSSLSGVGATNAASATTTLTVNITNAVSQSVTLTPGSGGAALVGSTVYYRGNAAGSFTLTDAVTAAGSGSASATFPAIGTTGWTHNVETVTTPAGGPYVSTPWSWTANPSTPSSKSITGTDSVGNTTTTALTFTSDATAPTTPTITFPVTTTRYNAATWTGSITGTTSDSGSGVGQVGVTVQRGSDSKFWNGTTWQSGSFTLVATGTTSWSQPFAPPALTDDTYTITATATDNVGNQSGTATSTFTYDSTNPTISSVTMSGGTAGRIDTGDTISIVFSEQMKVSSFCSSWSSDTSNQVLNGANEVTVAVADGTGATNDSITVTSSSCTFNFGSINLGSNAYLSGGNVTYADSSSSGRSTISWTASTHTLTITLGTKNGNGTTATVASSTPVYTASSSITDSVGNQVGNSPFTLPTGQKF